MIVRVSWLPAALEQVIALVERIGADAGDIVELAGRAGVGAGLIRVDGGRRRPGARGRRASAKTDVVGHVVVLRADPAVKEQADVWGPPGDTAALMRRDQTGARSRRGILNANRGPM